MALTNETVQEYREILEDEYKLDLTDAEAREQGERLVKFFEILIEIDQRGKQK